MIPKSGLIKPPYAIPRHYMSPWLWKFFRSLSLPRKVATVWWRLLQGKVGYQTTLFRWNSTLWKSSVCTICRSESETNHHFFVSCFRKWPIWQAALTELSLIETLPTPDTVWTVLYTFHDKNCVLIEEDILISLSVVLESIWRYHWRCVLDDEPWSDLIAIPIYKNSLSKSTTETISSTENETVD